MHKKRYPAIFLSVAIFILGLGVVIKMVTDWNSDELIIDQPVVNLIKESDKELDLQSIIHEAEKSVIQIEGHNEHETITGSGFLYNDEGDIITNAHVVQNTDAIYVKTSNARFYPAAIIGISDEVDIAVLRVPQLANQDTLPLAKEPAVVGDDVIALGSPHGFQNTATLGIISGTERNFNVDGFTYSNAYQISAQITHGNSGGPLIHRDTGEIIGINSVGTEDGMIGFSIPIEEVIDDVVEWSNLAVTDELQFSSVTDIVSNINVDESLDDAIYLTEYFWDSIAIRDYISAYSLLASGLQQSSSYAEFRGRYIHLIDLRINDPTSEVIDNNQIRTTIEVEFIERDADQTSETVTPKEFEFIFSFENDQLKITQINEQ